MPLYLLCLLSSFSVLFVGCSYQDEWESDQVGNFEALWTIMDEHYSFFDYKQVDWNEVHARYRALVSIRCACRRRWAAAWGARSARPHWRGACAT